MKTRRMEPHSLKHQWIVKHTQNPVENLPVKGERFKTESWKDNQYSRTNPGNMINIYGTTTLDFRNKQKSDGILRIG